MSTPFQQTPYLRQQRDFPGNDIKMLAVQSDKAYIDVATAVNQRIIGIFARNVSMVTGEGWYIEGGNQKQQTLRQIYTFKAAGNIAHNINVAQISGFTRIYGTFTDGTNWYPLPYVDVVAANNQVGIHVTPTNIVISSGGGSPPSISSGFVVLEFLSLV